MLCIMHADEILGVQTKYSPRLLSYSLGLSTLLPQQCLYPIFIVTTNGHKHSDFKTPHIYYLIDL